MLELLRILVDLGFGVTFVPYNGADVPQYSAALGDLGIEFLPEQTNLAPLLQQLSPDLRVAILSRPMPVVALLAFDQGAKSQHKNRLRYGGSTLPTGTTPR